MANNINTKMSAEALSEVSAHNATNSNNNNENAAAVAAPATTTTTTIGDNNLNINQTPPHHTNPNDTISAPADSSDNQADPVSASATSTLNEHQMSIDQQQKSFSISHHVNPHSSQLHQPHHSSFMSSMYGRGVPPSLYSNALYKTMPPMHMNSQMALQQQHQPPQSQQQLQQQGPTTYSSYLNSYQQFYQEQQQQQQHQQQSTQNLESMDYLASTTTSGTAPKTSSNVNDFYCNSSVDGEATTANVDGTDSFANPKLSTGSTRYHPYNLTSTISSHSVETQQPTASSSPRMVSSTSPSNINNHSNATNLANSVGRDNGISGGDSTSGIPNSNTSPSAANFTCAKCGFICASEIALQDHIKYIHTSPYQHHHRTYNGSTPNTPVSGPIEQTQSQNLEGAQHDVSGTIPSRNATGSSINPGDILDLDSRKLLYPPLANASLPNNVCQSLYSMQGIQKNANVSNWNQQQQQTSNASVLPSYITTQQQVSTTDTKPVIIHQPNSPFNQSPKQSPFSGASSIKSEYSGIGINTQQTMNVTPVVSSSPAEFPSTTTTEGMQDGQQHNPNQQNQQRLSKQQPQQRQLKTGQQCRSKNNNNSTTGSPALNFEAPTSSSAMPPNQSGTTKPANWKSNEPRRPKTYNCTACNKWFTSSGHLKRHYNTTLHKNAVKQSGKPDPCTLPISQFHHPSRDPNYKTNRRGNGSITQRHQQQQQHPSTSTLQQPPDTSTHLASNLNIGSVNSFANPSPPNTNFNSTAASTHHYLQQQQQQEQYLTQCQTTAVAAPLTSSTLTNNLTISTMPYEQNENIMNGHPNGLAGLSVQTTISMPYSPVRGLLNSISTTTATLTPTITIVKTERETATPMEEQSLISRIPFMEVMQTETDLPMVEPKVEEEEEDSITMSATEDITTTNNQLWVWQQDLMDQCAPIRQLPPAPPSELDQVPIHHSPHLLDLDLVQVVEEDNYNLQHIPPHNMHKTMHTPPIIYQDTQVLPQDHQMLAPISQISSLTLQQPPQQQQQPPSITEVHQQPPCPPPTPLDINMQHNSTLLQQQPATTIRIHTPIHTINMDNMLLNLAPLMELQPLTTNITTIQPLDINISTHQVPRPSQHTTHNNNSIIPTLPHLDSPHPQHQVDPIPTSPPHTTTGNCGSNNQLDQITSTTMLTPPKSTSTSFTKCTVYGYTKGGSNIRQISPRQGDLPPKALSQYHLLEDNVINITANSTRTTTSSPSHNFPIKEQDDADKENIKIVYEQQNYHYRPQSIKSKATSNSNNKRSGGRTEKSNGPHICLICNKAFFNQCYLTQHNDKIHSGKYEYRCKHCGKGYNDLIKFDNHVKCHTNPDKKHKCTLCIKQYNHKSDLTRHIAVCHEKAKNQDKLHYCDICGKDFIRRDQLRTHIKSHLRRSRKEKNAKGACGRNSAAIANTNIRDKESYKIEQLCLELI